MLLQHPYYINLTKQDWDNISSIYHKVLVTNEYPRNAQLMVDGMAAIRSVPLCATYGRMVQNNCNIYYTTSLSEAWVKPLDIIMEAYKKLSFHASRQEFSKSGEFSLELRHFDKYFHSEFFTLRYSKTAF